MLMKRKLKKRASSLVNLTDSVVQSRMIKSDLSFQIFKKMFFIFNKQMIFFFDVSATIFNAFFVVILRIICSPLLL